MTTYIRVLFLGMIFLVHSCTGQNPAPIKNSTIPKKFVKESCSSMVFEGQVLRKHNILNILDCSGWAKQYPELYSAVSNSNEQAVDSTFKVFNDQFFSTKEQRKAFFELVANAESRGELGTLSKFIQKGLTDHKVLGLLNKALKNDTLNLTERSDFIKVLSVSNEENLKLLRALKNVTVAYEFRKPTINALFSPEDKEKLAVRLATVLSEIAGGVENKSWKELSSVFYNEDSSIMKTWAVDGAGGNLRIILDVIEEPNFVKDIKFLNSSLKTGITCSNKSSTRDFDISISQELDHKIEGLKYLEKDKFEKMLVHGLTKYVAFQAFCEEKEKKQGVDAFYQVLKHAFSVLPSQHDFIFLKEIHKVFGDNKYALLSFLSSETFGSLRGQLLDFKSGDRDTELVRNLYEVLAEMSEEDLKSLADLINELSVQDSKSQNWVSSWGKLWKKQTAEEKSDFIGFLGVFLAEDLKASDALNLMETVFVAFPEFSPAFSNSLTDITYQENLRHVVEVLSPEGVQKDLSGLLSDRGIFEFISILTQDYKAPESAKPAVRVEPIPSPYVSSFQSAESIQTRACFDVLTKNYEKDSSYYNLVNTLPDVCDRVLADVGFVGQIYLWMNASNNYFRNRGISDFHAGTGVWSPGMLQFIFSAAVKADMALRSAGGKAGIYANISQMHSELTNEQLLKTFREFSLFYGMVDKKLLLDTPMLNFINSKNDKELNALASNAFKILEPSQSQVNYVIQVTGCEKIDSRLGANPCLTKDKLITDSLFLMKILKRKNQNDKSLATELVSWLHPKGGVSLPFGLRDQRTHYSSLEDVVHFLYDLSDEKTSKDFQYKTDTTETAVKGTVIDRLEVVIRDIGFKNNFYGAYFKNEVASAKFYRRDVEKSEKLLVLLDRTSGVFRRFGKLPLESKYKLKNIRATYSSLVEVSDQYVQADGSTRSYENFIQSMLAAIVSSSEVSTQKFNAYRIPSEGLVEGHNGVFLTKFVEMSGLRHLSAFVRARFDKDLSALNTETFRKINKNLLGRHEIKDLQSAMQLMLDKYLDADRNQLNLMVEDGINFLSTLDAQDLKELEQIALKGAILLSDEKISNKNIKKLAYTIEFAVKMWPEIRQILMRVEDPKKALRFVNKFMDNLVSHPKELDTLAEQIGNYDSAMLKNFEELLAENDFQVQSAKLLNNFIAMEDFKSSLNWGEVAQAVFSQDMQWESLKDWLQTSLSVDKSKLSVSVLIALLGEEGRLESILDEVLVKHPEDLKQFLVETFPALRLE